MTKYLIAITLILVTALVFTCKSYVGRGEALKIAKANEKSYVSTIATYKDANGNLISEKYALQQSISTIMASNGKEVKELRALIKNSDLKLKDLIAHSSTQSKVDTIVKTKIEVGDSIYHFVVNPEFKADVTIRNSFAYFHPVITNTQILSFFHKRETINPPKKFFLWRWLQKKHIVVKTIVRNSNQAIKTTSINATYIIK